jgi:hypothetical protein
MKRHDGDEELLHRLSGLRVVEADAARLERVRARCHAALVARQHQADRRRSRRAFAARVLEPVFVGTLSASYLLAMVFVLLRLHGII